MHQKIWSQFKLYGIITLSITIMAIGVYFFKFPNNFVFGGVTGAAALFSSILPVSAGTFSSVTNILLLVLGLVFLGKNFAATTCYATVLLSAELMVFEKILPLSAPLSNQPMLDLIFAIALPAIGSSTLFSVGASSGGTDIIALIVEKYTNINSIASALFLTDLIMVIAACFVFDLYIALYSFVGLAVKSLVIDAVLDRIKQRKAILIVCSEQNRADICDFIINELHKGATYAPCVGAYTQSSSYFVYTALYPTDARKLRAFAHTLEGNVFISMLNTTEVFGKGFINI